MKMSLHPLTVEVKETEIVLSQVRAEGSATPIIIAVEQVEQVCELLYRARKAIWQNHPGDAAPESGKKPESFGK